MVRFALIVPIRTEVEGRWYEEAEPGERGSGSLEEK